MSQPKNIRESSEIPRAELIYMIAKLRGVLHSVKSGKKGLDWNSQEVGTILSETQFNISQDSEDNVDWNAFK